MTSPSPTVHVDIRVPLAATEQMFLQLAVQAAVNTFRKIRPEGSDSAEPLDGKSTGGVQ